MDGGDMTNADRYMLCLHLRSGEVQMTPYRSLQEALYVADLLGTAARCGSHATPPIDVPCVYLFPPNDEIEKVEIQER
jgi:hypothetical protein